MFYCSNKGKALILFVVLGVLLTFSKLAVLATSSSDSVQSSEVLSSKTEEINLNIKDYKSNDKIDESLNKWDAESEKKFQVLKSFTYKLLYYSVLLMFVLIFIKLLHLLYLVLNL